jgi:hypothetical protein
LGNDLLPASKRKIFTADEDGMHADSMRLNKLPGHIIGRVFVVLSALWASAGGG